jgi:heme A synthase
MRALVRFAWFVLGFNVAVILLGALVRATGSGAGCGSSWPTCDGEVLPELSGATAVEFTHRAMSGVALILVATLVVWVFRSTPPGRPARAGAVLAMVAIVGEALIGAVIVLAEWVANDASAARAVAVPLHLVNTLLLLAALTLTIFWLRGGRRLAFQEDRTVNRYVLLGGLALVLIAGTGAVTALADTLFPKDGILGDPGSEHFLTGLRVVHPILAVIAASMAWWLSARSSDVTRRSAKVVSVLVGVMLLSGVLNVALGVPVWMQLVHLVLADALWITYVLISATALQASEATESRLSPSR